MPCQRITFEELGRIRGTREKKLKTRKCRFILCANQDLVSMGAKPSSISDLQHNPVLQKFTGDTAIGEEEEFWEDILAFSFQAPYNR